MTYEQLFLHVTNNLKDSNKIEALKLLLLELVGEDSAFLYLHYNDKAPKEFSELYLNYANKYLIEHVPVQHLLGYSYFYGRKFIVNEDVLIPRPETENLVALTLSYYDTYFSGKKVDVLDLGTGSGAIGITLDLEEENMNVLASDLSEKALKTATETSHKLGSKTSFIQSNWFSNINKKYDIITANPPYIPSLELVEEEVTKEPSLALYGGSSGLDYYEEILKNINNYLKEYSFVIFEHGYDQAEKIEYLIRKYVGDVKIKTYKDLAGKVRNTVFVKGEGIGHDI